MATTGIEKKDFKKKTFSSIITEGRGGTGGRCPVGKEEGKGTLTGARKPFLES